MLKEALNGGAFGRLNTKNDWQEDPSCLYEVTIGCQLELLYCIETLQSNGFQLLSANTDGGNLIFDKSRLNEFFDIMENLEKEIGNDILGNFEYTVFEWMAQTSVNHYLAKKSGEYINRVFKPHISKDDKDWLKAKGLFEYYKELHKNSSFSIIPLSLQKYYDEGINPEDFIGNHNDIFDFCARNSAGWDFYHESINGNKKEKLPKLIRYYVSKNGTDIMKMVKPTCLTGANSSNVKPADKKKTFCNKLTKDTWGYHLQNVDRQWYIDEVNKLIQSVKRNKKKSKIILPPKEQLKLDF